MRASVVSERQSLRHEGGFRPTPWSWRAETARESSSGVAQKPRKMQVRERGRGQELEGSKAMVERVKAVVEVVVRWDSKGGRQGAGEGILRWDGG